MRIATSMIYAQQTSAIDDQQALYAQIGQQLSTGKQLNDPSDDPTRIGQDLQLHTALDTTAQQANNVQSAVSELTTTDSALSSLTSVLQSARQLAVQGASQGLTDDQRSALANQLDELVRQSIAIGNTQYGGKYVFAGTASTPTAPVQQQGSPITGVSFSGNEQVQGQLIYNNQQFALSTTFQAAFNYASADGSPDVFQTLISLRDTLANKLAVDRSAQPINAGGKLVYGPAAGAAPPPTAAAATRSRSTARSAASRRSRRSPSRRARRWTTAPRPGWWARSTRSAARPGSPPSSTPRPSAWCSRGRARSTSATCPARARRTPGT
jgi:flagellar hook-associated protein 3